MAEADLLQHYLLEAQNSDGGWGYQDGSSQKRSSWTEPTALVLLALQAVNGAEAACASARSWLLHSQKADGGWAPQPLIEESSWVTSVATLALASEPSAVAQHRRGISWLQGQILPADNPLGQFLSRFRGDAPDPRPAGGSPWFPGTAAWLGPTAMSVVALSFHAARTGDGQLRSSIAQGQNFILSRRCRDGGWNHGGSKYRSQNANSYPEMTGMALLALRGTDPSELRLPLALAVSLVQSAISSEALSWLQLGLLAHGHDQRAVNVQLPCRTIRDVALRVLALCGPTQTNKFLNT